MTIREIVGQGFYYARTCRSLWLFGFVVGLASGGGSNGGGGGSGDGGTVGLALGGGLLALSRTTIALIAIFIVLAIAAVVVMRFVAEGALIEGVVHARGGRSLSMREGFRAGWAHWGVLVRIALLYLAAILVSLGLLVAPSLIALLVAGTLPAVLLAIPAAVIAVPWFVTIELVKTFALRIAVLENRRATDAIHKARLFLHGRLIHGLKLMVATFVGTLLIGLLTAVAIVPVVLLLVSLIPVLRVYPVIVIACIVLLPAAYVLIAILGTFRSSVWTIGYVTQVES